MKHKLTIGIASLCTIAVGGVGYWAWDASHVRTFRSDLERDAASERWIEEGGYKRWTTTEQVANRGQIPNPAYPAWKEKEDSAKAKAVANCSTAGGWRRQSTGGARNLYPLSNPGARGEKPELKNFTDRFGFTGSDEKWLHSLALRTWERHPSDLAAWQQQERKRSADIAKDQQECRDRAEKRTFTFPRVSETEYGITGYDTVTRDHTRAWRRCRWESELNQDVCWDTRSDEANRRYTYFRVQ